MKIQKTKISLIATSILLPMLPNMVHADNINQENIEQRMVTGNSVNFRKGPSTSYDSLGKLYKGYKVEYIGENGNWVNVKYNGQVGYIHGDYVSNNTSTNNNTSSNGSTKIVNAGVLNIRKGPGIRHSKVGALYNNTSVKVISEDNGWSKINHNGSIGYVSSRYLKDSNENNHSSNNNSHEENTSNESNNIKGTKIVDASSLNFRKGPGTGYSKLCSIPNGTSVGIIDQNNGWSKISYNGQVGYVSSQYLKNSSEENASNEESNKVEENTVKSKKIVNASSLNVRKGAGTGYSKIGSISNGTSVGIIDQNNGWSKISYNGQIGYVSSQYLKDEASNNNNESPQNNGNIIEFAKQLLGKSYVWGAEGPNSFDCSGFTQYVFKNSAGVRLPRVSKSQSKVGQYVSRNGIKEGDLLFFDTSGSNNGSVSHVGIYMGNNKMIHASSGKGRVVISELSNYYNNAFVNARRVL